MTTHRDSYPPIPKPLPPPPKPPPPPEPTQALASLDEPSLTLLPTYVEHFLERVRAWALSIGTAHEPHVLRLFESPVQVETQEQYIAVGEDLLPEIAERRRLIVETFKPFKNAAHQLHTIICDREKALLRPLTLRDAEARNNWLAFERAEKQRRREEEARLAEEAQARERDRLAREAAALEQRGELTHAAAVLEQAVTVERPVIVLPTTTPTVAGISSAENWKWRAIDGNDKAVKVVPREYLMLDEKKLNAYARTHRGAASIPGIEFYDAGKVSVRR